MEPKHYNHHLSLSCIFLILLLLNNPFPTSSHDEHHDRSPPLATFLPTLMSARKGTSTKGLSLLKNYLSRFGYIDNNNNDHEQTHDSDLFDNALEVALKKYQTYFQLPASGALDATTAAQLRRPRCGVPDNGILAFKDMNRSSYFGESHYSFFPGAPKWPAGKRDLTYSFPPRQSADFLFKFSSEMTKKWERVSPFKFSYTRDYEHADIKISFARRDHGDGHPFDGPGGDLAHAYEPTDGRIHFDQDDKWVIGAEKDQFDVVTVGVHELGHALGLGHSDDKRAIMYPYMDSGISKNLAQDDIAGIRALYPH